jgi:hypothetical protein
MGFSHHKVVLDLPFRLRKEQLFFEKKHFSGNFGKSNQPNA